MDVIKSSDCKICTDYFLCSNSAALLTNTWPSIFFLYFSITYFSPESGTPLAEQVLKQSMTVVLEVNMTMPRPMMAHKLGLNPVCLAQTPVAVIGSTNFRSLSVNDHDATISETVSCGSGAMA